MIRTGLIAIGLATALVCTSAAQAETVLNRGNNGEPKSLDPHYIDLTLELNIVGDMLVGLTTEDAAGHAIPGAAESWNISPDGETWTFHLRNHVWSDGMPVTAGDFVFAWRRILDPKMGAPYAYQLWVVKNAHAISDGKLPVTALGVTAKDDKTLVVQLEHPAPYLPELLTHCTTYPLPRHVVEAKGGQWALPKNYVANGPYVLKEWIPNDHITLVKNPRFYDAAHVHIDRVNYIPATDSVAALKWMRAGALDTYNQLPSQEIIWIRANMKDALQMIPYLSIYYINFNFQHKPLDDNRVREAINLAFDREAVTQKIIRMGEPAAYGIVPPGTANYPYGAAMDFKPLSNPDRLKRAQALMLAAGYGSNNHLRIAYATTTNPDNKRTAAALQAMLRAIYVDVDIVQSDVQVHYKKLQTGDFDLGYANWVADFNDATNFLDLVRCDGGNNYGHYCNPKVDALLDKANQAPDIKQRGVLLRQAEDLALKDYAWLPMRFASTPDLVEPYVKGWIANARDINRSRWLWIDRQQTAER
jgi:oligopeptide transport system substrate-binding protein